MIDERYIKEWASTHPWRRAEQVEQEQVDYARVPF